MRGFLRIALSLQEKYIATLFVYSRFYRNVYWLPSWMFNQSAIFYSFT